MGNRRDKSQKSNFLVASYDMTELQWTYSILGGKLYGLHCFYTESPPTVSTTWTTSPGTEEAPSSTGRHVCLAGLPVTPSVRKGILRNHFYRNHSNPYYRNHF